MVSSKLDLSADLFVISEESETRSIKIVQVEEVKDIIIGRLMIGDSLQS